MSARYLTFDLGTTLYKVALFNDQGQMLALERVKPPIASPQPGWAIVDPGAVHDCLVDGAQRLKARTGNDWSDVAAVSYATQANSFSLLDDAADELTDYILWSDQRASAMAQQVGEIAATPDFRRTTGMPRFSPALALAKLLWLKHNNPAVLKGAKSLCFISSVFARYLTQGPDICETSEAALSGAFDIHSLQWQKDTLKRMRVGSIQMPQVRRAGTNLGQIPRGPAREFGLPETCQFIVGCLDQYAGAIGTGTVTPGRVCETTGTVLAAVRLADRFDENPPPDVYQGPAFAPGKFFQMSFSSTSANLLEAYRNNLADRPTFEELSHSAAAGDTHRGQEVQAIMRRVAEALRDQVRSLCGDQMPAEIRSSGGGAKSDIWLKIKAQTLGVPFVRMECEEPTSLGAAMLAAHGLTGEPLESLATRWVRTSAVFTPAQPAPSG